MQRQIHRLGRDRVIVEKGHLLVEAAVDMPDWEVRAFRRTCYIFGGEEFFLAEKTPRGKSRVDYVLEPWPRDSDEPPVSTVVYDEEYVRVRDRGHRHYATGRLVSPFLVVFYPVLGFLPGRLKLLLSERVGLHPVRSSVTSIVCGFLGGLWSLPLLPVLARIPELEPHIGKITLVALLLIIDAVARYHRRLAEDPYPYGFFEWLFGRKQL